MKKILICCLNKEFKNLKELIKNDLSTRLDNFLLEYNEQSYFINLDLGFNDSDFNHEDLLESSYNEIANNIDYMIVLLGREYGDILDDDSLNKFLSNKKIEKRLNDISLLEFECSLPGIVNLDLNSRILYYFSDSNASKDNHKDDKLTTLRQRITEKYPENVTYFSNDSSNDDILNTIYSGLSSLIKKDYDELEYDSTYMIGLYASENLFKEFTDNIIFPPEVTLHDFEEKESYVNANFTNTPLLELIEGTDGMGKKTLLAFKYKKSLESKDVLSIPYACHCVRENDSLENLRRIMIHELEDYLNIKHKNVDTDDYLIKLLAKNDRAGGIVRVFVMNANHDIFDFLKMIEAKYYFVDHITFYIAYDYDEGEGENYPPFYHRHIFLTPEYNYIKERKNIINNILNRHNFSFSTNLINEIAKKKCLELPLYYSLLIEYLAQLDNDDNSLIKIVREIDADLEKLATVVMKHILKKYGSDFIYLFSYLSNDTQVSFKHVEGFYRYFGYQFIYRKMNLVINRFSSLFFYDKVTNILIFRCKAIELAARKLLSSLNHKKDVSKMIDYLENGSNINSKQSLEAMVLNYHYENRDVDAFADTYLDFINKLSDTDAPNDFFDNEEIMSVYFTCDMLLLHSYEKENMFVNMVIEKLVDYLIEDKVAKPEAFPFYLFLCIPLTATSAEDYHHFVVFYNDILKRIYYKYISSNDERVLYVLRRGFYIFKDGCLENNIFSVDKVIDDDDEVDNLGNYGEYLDAMVKEGRIKESTEPEELIDIDGTYNLIMKYLSRALIYDNERDNDSVLEELLLKLEKLEEENKEFYENAINLQPHLIKREEWLKLKGEDIAIFLSLSLLNFASKNKADGLYYFEIFAHLLSYALQIELFNDMLFENEKVVMFLSQVVEVLSRVITYIDLKTIEQDLFENYKTMYNAFCDYFLSVLAENQKFKAAIVAFLTLLTINEDNFDSNDEDEEDDVDDRLVGIRASSFIDYLFVTPLVYKLAVEDKNIAVLRRLYDAFECVGFCFDKEDVYNLFDDYIAHVIFVGFMSHLDYDEIVIRFILSISYFLTYMDEDIFDYDFYAKHLTVFKFFISKRKYDKLLDSLPELVNKYIEDEPFYSDLFDRLEDE